MKIALYPGSFNPWHEGHEDVLNKALQSFDKVIVVKFINPEKSIVDAQFPLDVRMKNHKDVYWARSSQTLKDFIESQDVNGKKISAIVKGLRNAQDLEYETCQQYWNEDLGVKTPFFYIITDRKLRHISSTAKRMMEKLKNNA